MVTLEWIPAVTKTCNCDLSLSFPHFSHSVTRSLSQSPTVEFWPATGQPPHHTIVSDSPAFLHHTATALSRAIFSHRHLELSIQHRVSLSPQISYTGAATSDRYCNYALGVLEKATQTLKIVPIVSNKASDHVDSVEDAIDL